MTNQLTKALAALAVVAVLGSVGPQSARAQRSYPSGSAGDTGFTWDQALSPGFLTNSYGPRAWASSGAASPGRALGYNTAPYPAAPANYYAGALTYGVPASAGYSYGAFSPSGPAAVNTARIRLFVPSGAKVWFGGAETRQTGLVRDFESPPLTPGKDYRYDITARWTEDGREVTRTRPVDVRANSWVAVDFTPQ
jgi:uncharacterized protein (TIGR03000 family)